MDFLTIEAGLSAICLEGLKIILLVEDWIYTDLWHWLIVELCR